MAENPHRAMVKPFPSGSPATQGKIEAGVGRSATSLLLPFPRSVLPFCPQLPYVCFPVAVPWT